MNSYRKRAWNAINTIIYKKTPYVWSNKFTPPKKILHNRWLWCLRHLEGLVQCTVSSVLCPMYCVQCTVNSVLYTGQWTMGWRLSTGSDTVFWETQLKLNKVQQFKLYYYYKVWCLRKESIIYFHCPCFEKKTNLEEIIQKQHISIIYFFFICLLFFVLTCLSVLYSIVLGFSWPLYSFKYCSKCYDKLPIG